MTYKQVCTVNNNQVTITLPSDFKNQKQVIVVINDAEETRTQKLEQLKQAANDPLFLSDIQEIHQDFDSIENEIE